MSHVTQTTVDLSEQPNVVVIYLGMRVRTLRGMRTLRSIAKEIEHAAATKPDRAATPRDAVLLADRAARRHAPVLARLRRPRAPGPLTPA